jgi:Flp pilus assembly protein TadG
LNSSRQPELVGKSSRVSYLIRNDGASAIVEFAVALPLLVVLVVGIFDFGAAFNLKQELNNAVREGARFGASQPTNDLCTACATAPPSVNAVAYLVDSYLQAANINDCGLSGTGGNGGGGLSWTYNATGNGCTLSLTISRNIQVTETVGSASVYLLSTQVTILYPFQWHFNSVIQLLVPGAHFALTNISTNATATNMD